jgi:hypothetical protein
VDKQNEEEIPGQRLIQSFAIFMAGVALVSAIMMTYKAGRVYLGIESDPYGRDLIVGTWVGIPTAIAGAVCAYIALMGRGWNFFRISSLILLTTNLLVPLSWIIICLSKQN